ncbi:pyruvate kinase [Methylomarinovum caldicuralii]|uniref:Pyruvate kinase n=1 Tax=Methylomarinovum caldicuralii TaxID=438856 RepID=A0AAU9CX35_9GAMM|nr:pyruvate kinase [Methylomarinovum caldicuralii]BCX82552.1 pyruvate kinase [Methylomarinovum caldicuralii]
MAEIYVPRRTKIVATLGPASDSPEVLERLIDAGVDVFRLNFSHGTADDHRRRARLVREISESNRHYVGILADLQGPKIRIGRFKDGKVFLEEGARFALDADYPLDQGDETQVGLVYRDLPRDVRPGDVLLLDDGRVVLKVDKIVGNRVECIVVVGGALSDNKGINKQGGGLSAPALTEKDKEDIRTAVEIEADYLAVSFPRSAADIHLARRLLREAGGEAGIVAKIERAEAVQPGVMEEIIEASDVIMVARGDLGVEIGDARLPQVQKDLISKARDMDRVVITATQMMESMIESPLPTRAEVLDVANAVFDGTDAVMLSAETASGKYPVEAVKAMHRVCVEAEKSPRVRRSSHRMDRQFKRTDEAIAMASMYVANHFPVRAIAALTESGATPLWMSRIRSGIPIYALTRHLKTCRKVRLYRGVYPILFRCDTTEHAVQNKAALEELLYYRAVTEEDRVLITKGDLTGVSGGTNTLKIVKVRDALALTTAA